MSRRVQLNTRNFPLSVAVPAAMSATCSASTGTSKFTVSISFPFRRITCTLYETRSENNWHIGFFS